MALLLVAGEKEQISVGPTAIGWLRHYARAMPALLIGVGAVALAGSPAWSQPAAAEPSLQDLVWGTPLALLLIATTALLLTAVAWWFAHRRTWALVYAALGPAATGASIALGYEHAAAWFLLGTAGVVLAGVELQRLTTRYIVTNLRTVRKSVWPPALASVHHADAADVDVRPVYGTKSGHLLVLGRESESVLLEGVGNAKAVHDLVSLVVQRATATEYLRRQQDLDARILDALAGLRR